MRTRQVIRASAKINLGLNVLSRRPDGYHELESVMQQISLADLIVLEPYPDKNCRFSCTVQALSGPDNLVFKAVQLLEEKAGEKLGGVAITLYKNIPLEAGLAGGSSDAAAALIGLNRFWNLGFSKDELNNLASQLGSDVTFCLGGGTALAMGRGEIIERLPALPFFWVVLAVPKGIKILTAEAYGALDQRNFGNPVIIPLIEAIRNKSKRGILDWLQAGKTNTLETVRGPGFDKVQQLKRRLVNLGLMPLFSGSGPTLFMLFEQYSLARNVSHAINQEGDSAYLCWTMSGNEEWLDV
ncbi:MAG: 4-(cytidine 5'-diphospho)-2-C-methyl-D-erythritol kinase [Bacillota bacterium]|nr:4-(cytidine 5'-diphospho)-2-C-methyl-D-erythritol kinase [Bacillota bacterium]